METLSVLLAFCAGNSPVTGEFPAQRPVTWTIGILFDLRLDKRLNKQSWGWGFQTPSRSLWRHLNGTISIPGLLIGTCFGINLCSCDLDIILHPKRDYCIYGCDFFWKKWKTELISIHKHYSKWCLHNLLNSKMTRYILTSPPAATMAPQLNNSTLWRQHNDGNLEHIWWSGLEYTKTTFFSCLFVVGVN